METLTTLYKAYRKKDETLNRKQYLAVGRKARNLFQQITGQLPEKLEQQEPARHNYTGKNPRLMTYQVFAYPVEFEQLIFNLIDEEVKMEVTTKPNQDPVHA